jgi:hypothetical protein
MDSRAPIILPISDNLRAVVHRADDNTRAAVLHIQAKDREEPVAFRISTTSPIISHFWELPQLRGGNWLTVAEEVTPDGYRLWVNQSFLNHPLVIGLEFQTDSDPAMCVSDVCLWDGEDGSPSIIYLESDTLAESGRSGD